MMAGCGAHITPALKITPFNLAGDFMRCWSEFTLSFLVILKGCWAFLMVEVCGRVSILGKRYIETFIGSI